MKPFSLALIGGVLLLLVGCEAPKKVAPPAPEIKVQFFSTQQGLPSEQITAMAAFGGQIWAGTKKGLTKFDGVNWQIFVKKNTNALGSDMIEALYVGDNALYIATENGVTKYDGTNWNSAFTGSRARGVAVKGPEIAVATAHGVDYSSGGTFNSLGKDTAGLVFEEVNTVAFDASGTLWVGTRAGMAQLRGLAFQNYTGPAKTVMGTSLVDVPPSPANCQLIGNNITCLLPYKGMLAIGTTSGLSITDMGNQWKSYTGPHKDWFQRMGKIVEEQVSANSPLQGNSITALASYNHDSALIVGTNKGVAALQDSAWIDLQSRIPTLRPGHITGLAVLKEDLWIGTQGGIFRVPDLGSVLSQLPTK